LRFFAALEIVAQAHRSRPSHLQRALHAKAKAEAGYRFCGHVCLVVHAMKIQVVSPVCGGPPVLAKAISSALTVNLPAIDPASRPSANS
jgi:hypothetical protein